MNPASHRQESIEDRKNLLNDFLKSLPAVGRCVINFLLNPLKNKRFHQF
jgi:hypothetical protein